MREVLLAKFQDYASDKIPEVLAICRGSQLPIHEMQMLPDHPLILLETLQVGCDVGDGLRGEAEVGGVVHQRAPQWFEAGDAGFGNGLGLAAHGFDDHGVALTECDAHDGDAIFRFDLGAFVAVRNFRAGFHNCFDDDLAGLLTAKAGKIGAVVDALLANFMAHVATRKRSFPARDITFQFGDFLGVRECCCLRGCGWHFHGYQFHVRWVLSHGLE